MPNVKAMTTKALKTHVTLSKPENAAIINELQLRYERHYRNYNWYTNRYKINGKRRKNDY